MMIISVQTSRKLSLKMFSQYKCCSVTGKKYACRDKNNQSVANDQVKDGDVCEIICQVRFFQLIHIKQ